MLIAVIILSAALIAALGRFILVKRDIKIMSRNLGEIISDDTNAKITTRTFDRDLTALAENVNHTLARNRRVLYEKERAESDLKRAVTNISHDLRTPLTSALGYLQMLEGIKLNNETRARYISTVRGRLDALAVLMNNLFEFAKIIEGATPLKIQKVNAGGMLRDVLSANYPELTAKGFTVETDIPDAPVIFFCDEDALLRITQNLIMNVRVHGREYLRVRLKDNLIEVANKADGIKELDTEKIFERFYTTDASRTSKNTGLGLAIVKELTSRLGFTVSAETEGDLFVIRVETGKTHN